MVVQSGELFRHASCLRQARLLRQLHTVSPIFSLSLSFFKLEQKMQIAALLFREWAVTSNSG
jgi:hypothetical protein